MKTSRLAPALFLFLACAQAGHSIENLDELKINRKWAQTLFYLAEQKAAKQKWTEAVQYYRMGLIHDPLNTDMRYKLGYALAQGGNLKAAVKELAEVIRQDPFHNDAKRRLKKYKHLDHFINEDYELPDNSLDLKKPVEKIPATEESQYAAIPRRPDANVFYMISHAEDMQVMKGQADNQIAEAKEGSRVLATERVGIVTTPSGAPAGAYMPVGSTRQLSEEEKIQALIDEGEYKIANEKLMAIASGKGKESLPNWCDWLLGQMHHRQGHFTEAENHLETLVKAVPNNMEYLFLLAKTQLKAGQVARATGNYEKILKNDPKNVFANLDLALIYSLEEKPKKAREIYDRLLVNDPRLMDAQIAIAELDLLEGQGKKAEERLLRILEEQDPNNLPAINLLGEVYFKRNDLDRALLQFDKAIAMESRYGRAHHNKGLVLWRQNQLDGALGSLSACNQLEKTNLYNTYKLVQLMVYMGKVEDAANQLSWVVKNHPTHAASYAVEGLVHKGRQNHQLAIIALDKATKLDAKVPEYWLDLVECHFLLKDFDNVIALSQTAAKKFPDFPRRFEFDNYVVSAREEKKREDEKTNFVPLPDTGQVQDGGAPNSGGQGSLY